LLINSEGI